MFEENSIENVDAKKTNIINENNDIRIKENTCKICGAQIKPGKYICDKCFENKRKESYKNTAVIATVTYIIIYILTFILSMAMSKLAEGLNGGEPVKLPLHVDIARTLSPCFAFAFIPFCISLVLSKKQKMYSLFLFNVILLIVHTIFAFI